MMNKDEQLEKLEEDMIELNNKCVMYAVDNARLSQIICNTCIFYKHKICIVDNCAHNIIRKETL